MRDLRQLALDLLVGDGIEQVRNDVDTRALFILGLHGVPRRGRGIGVDEHGILGAGVVLPAGNGLQIHGGELPAAQRIIAAGFKALNLLFIGDREPVLAQDNAVFHKHLLKGGSLVQEADVFLVGAKAHDALNAGAVVPRAVKDDDFALGGQLFHVALEIPLSLLARVRGR